MSNYRHLYQLIEDLFDFDGIRTLCLDLKLESGVDVQYENLAGNDNKRRKAMELQEFARRNRITPELLQVIHHLRPRADLTQFGGPEPDPTQAAQPQTAATTSDHTEHEPAPEGPTAGGTAIEYDNFDIRIRPTGVANEYWLEAKSPMGDTADPVRQVFPFENEDYQYLAKLLEDVQIAEPQNAEAMGEILRKFLFPASIQTLFSTSLGVSRNSGKEGLRVRIDITRESFELHQVPWEYCRDDQAFLALNDDTPLVRYLPTNREATPIKAPAPVKILLAWANPEDLPQLQVEDEINAVKEALNALTSSGKVIFEELPNATPTELFSKVAANPPHIFHFIGHGVTDERKGGAIALNNGQNKKVLLDASILQQIFQGNATKLIIFSACQSGKMANKTGKASSAYAFMGLAPRLVGGGLPAAIAMQYNLPNKAAKPFVQPLYDFLAQGKPLDWAVSKARLGLWVASLQNTYWGIPVLFMRAPDGNIWA